MQIGGLEVWPADTGIELRKGALVGEALTSQHSPHVLVQGTSSL